MDRYSLMIETDRDQPISIEGPWLVIAAALQALTKWEHTLNGVARIEVKRV